MPAKPAQNTPSYRLHKSSGNAIVTLVDAGSGRRKDVILGRHNTPESKAKYHALIARWEDAGRRLDLADDKAAPIGGVSVNAVCRRYCEHVEPLVSPTHFGTIKRSLDIVCGLYGPTSAAKIGPLRLKEVRTVMVGRGWRRQTINKCIRLIVKAFRWAASEEMVSPDVPAALATVPNLRPGEMGVSEAGKQPPVPEPLIDAVRPVLSRQVVAMIDVQRFSAMRSGEVVIMRAIDIDMAGDIWAYRPQRHKGQHLNKTREILLGPRAIAVIAPFLVGRAVDEYLFHPKEANAELKAEGAVGRRPGQAENARRTDRTIGDHYSPASYRRAVHRACDAVEVDRWSPSQLRHNAATEARRVGGLEDAQLMLGHGSATITDAVYAERDRAKLEAIVAKIG